MDFRLQNLEAYVQALPDKCNKPTNEELQAVLGRLHLSHLPNGRTPLTIKATVETLLKFKGISCFGEEAYQKDLQDEKVSLYRSPVAHDGFDLYGNLAAQLLPMIEEAQQKLYEERPEVARAKATEEAIALQKATEEAITLQKATEAAIILQKATKEAIALQKATEEAIILQKATEEAIALQKATEAAIILQKATEAATALQNPAFLANEVKKE